MSNTNDLRKQITKRIVEDLESSNLPPWRKPWRCDPNAGMPTNVVSKKRYSGINVLLLEASSMRHAFESKHWATYRTLVDAKMSFEIRGVHLGRVTELNSGRKPGICNGAGG